MHESQSTITSSRLAIYDVGFGLPEIRPGDTRRPWMDESPDAFAYRCLPLTIANGHGWEIIGDSAVEAVWNGGAGLHDLKLTVHERGRMVPKSHFGAGVLTFDLEFLVRTAPSVSLWLSGPPNAMKDGIAPLTGIIETDWTPAAFTMNWRFTRPEHTIRFERGEPIGFFFPLPRRMVPDTLPEIRSIHEDPALHQQHGEWRSSRCAFISALRSGGMNEKWQRHYHRGRMLDNTPGTDDHLTRIAARPFAVHQSNDP